MNLRRELLRECVCTSEDERRGVLLMGIVREVSFKIKSKVAVSLQKGGGLKFILWEHQNNAKAKGEPWKTLE